MRGIQDMFHDMLKAEFATLLSLKVPSGTLSPPFLSPPPPGSNLVAGPQVLVRALYVHAAGNVRALLLYGHHQVQGLVVKA